VKVELVSGGRGEFTVLEGDRVLWDKHVKGRFPEHQEILSQTS